MPTRKLLTAFTEQTVEALWQAVYQAVETGQTNQLLDRLAPGLRSRISEVVDQAASEQHDILADYGDTSAQLEQIQFA
ncbi:hypothetical protein D3C85_1878710 [compost metagenome]